MKAIISVTNTCRILLIGAVFLFAFGVLSPQPVGARMIIQRAMPVTDGGDPSDAWDYSGGGGGAVLPPPDETGWNSSPKNQVFSLDAIQMAVGNNVHGVLILTPHFDGKSIIWTIYILTDPMQGGSH